MALHSSKYMCVCIYIFFSFQDEDTMIILTLHLNFKRGGMERQVRGRIKREGTLMYLWLIHADVWQKPMQDSKAFILQLQMNK